MTLQVNLFAFRNRFSEFKDVGDDVLGLFLDFAMTQLDKATWDIGTDYEKGVLYLTAHLTAKFLQQQAQAQDGSGPTDLFVSSIHFGERSVSFGRRGETDTVLGALGPGEKGLDDTLYGQMFLMLRSRNVQPIAIV